LSPELQSLIEMLARNNHEVWAARRMAEGWRSNRGDEKKETAALVPYEELSESEEEYDRANAIKTLKTIIALGGRIEAPPQH